MSATLEAAIAAQDAQDAIEPEVVPDAPASPAPVNRTASFDDLLPDTEDIPPSFRNKPVRSLWDDRVTAVQQRDRAGQEKNEYETRLRVAEAALNVLGQPAEPRPAAPPPKLTPSEILRQRGIDTSALYGDPDAVLGRLLGETETAKSELRQEIEALKGEIGKLTGAHAVNETEKRNEAIRSAHRTAGASLIAKYGKHGLTPEQWVADASWLASGILANGMDTADPKSYEQAGEAFYSRTFKYAPAAAPVAPAAPAAPPVGNGAPAPVAVSGGTYIGQLTAKERETFDDITAGFGERIKISPERREKIARDVIEGRKGRRR